MRSPILSAERWRQEDDKFKACVQSEFKLRLGKIVRS